MSDQKVCCEENHEAAGNCKSNNYIEMIENNKKSCVEEDPFQMIMQKVGNHGRFQFIYNIIFVMGLGTCGAMVYMNIILALNIPQHWCTVPGQEQTNLTLDEWRHLTLPNQKDNRGADKYSNCEMYDVNFTQTDQWQHIWNASQQLQQQKGQNGQELAIKLTNANVTGCQHGWSYDQTWYENTIPSKENWVCANDLYVTNVFVVGRVTEVIGSFVLGQMGDICGRRPIFYLSVICCAVFRIGSILSTSWYTIFLICTCIVGITVNTLFQSPQIVGMEISRDKDRSTIAMYQSFGWSVGTSFMPLLFWWLRDWESFMWITTVPTALVLIFSKYVIESPRWLISKRRFSDAIVQFRKIAKINGQPFDLTEKELTNLYQNMPQEPTFGIASLFSGWRLARNTSIMGLSWCVVAVSYFTLVLFSSQMGGNPFLNFLLQSIVEIPAYCVAQYIGDKYGRRFTNCSSFFISFVACIGVICVATDAKLQWAMTSIITFIKFVNAITFFTASLQGMEIYPTCMRQTGIALGTILANAIGVLAPYLVYLGNTSDIRSPFYILCTLYFLGSFGAFFLPETLHKKLPDSMEEARQFGRYDKYFSLPKAPKIEPDTEKLNQAQYAP